MLLTASLQGPSSASSAPLIPTSMLVERILYLEATNSAS